MTIQAEVHNAVSLTRMQRIARCTLAIVSSALLLQALAVIAFMQLLHLGVIVPMVLGCTGLLFVRYWPQVLQWRASTARRKLLWRIGWGLLAGWLASVLLVMSHFFSFGLLPDQTPFVKAIVVLGSGTKDGQPRPALALRLDAAAAVAQKYPNALIAVCGGIDWGERESEATIMARYLEQRYQIPAQRILLEDQSTSTELNLLLSRPLLQARGINASAPVALVTSDFHLMRALSIAQHQGLTGMVPVAAPTPFGIRFNAWLREYFAILSSWLLNES